MDRDQEIRQIKQELALLRARYDGYRRAAAIMKALIVALVSVGALAAAIFAVNIFVFDALYGVFFLGAVLIFAVLIAAFVRWLDLRWIDFVSQSPRGIYSPYFFDPEIDPRARARSDAELIEWQIADRERALAGLVTEAGGH